MNPPFIRTLDDYLTELFRTVICPCASERGLCGPCAQREARGNIFSRIRVFWHLREHT